MFGRADLGELIDDLGRAPTVERPLHRPDGPATAEAMSSGSR
jgi:hypothetical protein